MPDRRVTVTISEDEHAAWTSAAREQGIPLHEYVRRAGNERSVEGAPLVDPDGNSAHQLRRLIRHYTRILTRMDRGELGWMVTTIGCGICLCHHYFLVLHHF